MIKESGEVVKVEGDVIWVKTQVTSTCNSCAAKSNCGTSSIAKVFGDKSVVNQVKNEFDAKLNDQVEIGIPEHSLVKGALLLYLLPLVSAISFALIGQFWLSRFILITEPLLIVLTFAGGGIGLLLARFLINRSDVEQYQVKLLRILPSTIDIKNVE